MSIDFDTYWFNNMGYHNIRSAKGDLAESISKLNIISIISGFKTVERLETLQLPLLLWSNICFIVYFLFRNKLTYISFAAVIGLTLSALYLLPNPIHIQYYSTVILFLVIGVIEMSFSGKNGSTTSLQPLKSYNIFSLSLLSLLVIITLIQTPSSIKRFTSTGKGVKGFTAATLPIFQLDTMRKVSKEISSHFSQNDTVVSQWPGFIFMNKVKPLLGMENQFWIKTQSKLPDEKYEKYKLMNLEKLASSLKNREIKGVVIEKRKLKRYLPGKILEREGFKMIKDIKSVLIYKRG